jgi:hypothetical protein
MGIIRFKVGDQFLVGNVLSQSTATSQHTGREITELEVQFKAHERGKKAVEDALAIGVGTVLAEGDSSSEFAVTLYQKQHSFTIGEPIQTYTWSLRQREKLMTESLKLGDMAVHPYRYMETISQDALVLTIRATVDATTLQTLRALPLYFPVVREGISDEPRSMRFGAVIWSSADEQEFKIQATIVEEKYDAKGNQHSFLEPMLGNLMKSVSSTNARFKTLVQILLSKGLITEEEKANIVEVSDEELRRRNYEFDRVVDVDEWFKREDDKA